MKFEIPENTTFEQAAKRLEQITALLEGGECTLEQSLSLYEEGRALAGYCHALLNQASVRIKELSEAENSEE